MKVRGEQGAAAVLLVQVLDRRPGDRQAVEGRGAAADLVEDDQAAFARLVEDRRGLDHLDHEGRAAAGQIVGRADAAEQPVDDADLGFGGRHERTDLRQQRDQRVLPQEGALARHVGAGDQPQPAVLALARQIAIIGDEGTGAVAQNRFDHRMAAFDDAECRAGVHARPAIAAHHRQFRQSGGNVERRHGTRRTGDFVGAGENLLREVVEQAELDRQRPLAGTRDTVVEVGQLDRGEAHGIRHGLPVDQTVALGQRLLAVGHQLVGVGRGDFDEIPQHVVVLDFEGGNAGRRGDAALQFGDGLTAFVAQLALLVERGRIARRDEAAVARLQRQRLRKRPAQALDQNVVHAKLLAQRGQLGRRRRFRQMRAHPRAQTRGTGQPAADGGEVARPAAAEPEPRQRAFDVGTFAQTGADILAQRRRLDKAGDQVETADNRRNIRQRRGQPVGQQPRPGTGDGAVDHRQQRAGARTRQGLREFEIAPRRRVDFHNAAGRTGRRQHLRARQPRQPVDLGQRQVVEQGSRRRGLGAAGRAERLQRGDAVIVGEAPFGVGRIEPAGGQRRHRVAQLGPGFEQRRLLDQRLGQQQLARGDARQRRRQIE